MPVEMSTLQIMQMHSYELFPSYEERSEWGRVAAENPDVVTFVTNQAEALLTEPIEPLPATKYMEFRRTGDRRIYEVPYFARRRKMHLLFLAEGFERKGRFIDCMINYIWAILDESTWCIPAHTDTEDPLPDFGDDVEHIDLFSAQTSNDLAVVLQCAEKEFAKVSPNFVKRFKRILEERTICPIEKYPDGALWWQNGRNNWTPWVCSSLMPAAIVLCKQQSRLNHYANLLLRYTYRYYKLYSDDGCCDEGPGYWQVAVMKMFKFLELLYRSVDGRFSPFYNDPKFIRMCEYISSTWMGKDSFAGFADCRAQGVGNVSRHFLSCAARLKNQKMFAYARAWKAQNPPVDRVKRVRSQNSLHETMFELFAKDPEEYLQPYDPADRDARYCVWYPVLSQAFVGRNAMHLALKGGTNGENHNHLDVGHFMFTNNGEHVIIDPGRTDYTRFTFSGHRYEHDVINSMGHNAPIFGSVGQHPGGDFGSKNAVCEERSDGTLFVAMDLEGAYDASLGIKSLRREWTLSPEGAVLMVTDSWELDRPLPVRVSFLTPCSVSLENGTIGSRAFFAVSGGSVRTESFSVPDQEFTVQWPSGLTRIWVEAPASSSGSMTYTFTLT